MQEVYTTEVDQPKMIVQLPPNEQIMKIHELAIQRKQERESELEERAKKKARLKANRQSFAIDFGRVLNKQVAYFDDMAVFGPNYGEHQSDFAWLFEWQGFEPVVVTANLNATGEAVVIDWDSCVRLEADLINNKWIYKVMAMTDSDELEWIISHHCTDVTTAVNYLLQQIISHIEY